MIARYASAITSGTLMTLGLLFVMQSLIALQPAAIVKPANGIGVDWIKMTIPDPPVRTLDDAFDKDKLIEPSDPPERSPTSSTHESFAVPKYGAAPPPNYGLPDLSRPSDGPLVALVRVSPAYPERARAKGLEGQVLVQFDVTELGYAVNVVVLDSTNSIFNQAAVAAAKRFKFKAQVVNGQAQPSYGLQNLFTFRMDQQ